MLLNDETAVFGRPYARLAGRLRGFREVAFGLVEGELAAYHDLGITAPEMACSICGGSLGRSGTGFRTRGRPQSERLTLRNDFAHGGRFPTHRYPPVRERLGSSRGNRGVSSCCRTAGLRALQIQVQTRQRVTAPRVPLPQPLSAVPEPPSEVGRSLHGSARLPGCRGCAAPAPESPSNTIPISSAKATEREAEPRQQRRERKHRLAVLLAFRNAM
jgi:hypothetical protein